MRKAAQLQLRPMLLKAIAAHAFRNELICRQIVEAYDKGRDCLVLADGVAHLCSLRDGLLDHGIQPEDLGLYVASLPAKYSRTPPRPRKDGTLPANVKQKPEDLLHVRTACAVILATYGMAKEGFDAPRLSFGIEASPRADAVQAVGRVRRPLPGKPSPVWVTITDSGIPLMEGMARSRRKELEAAGGVTFSGDK